MRGMSRVCAYLLGAAAVALVVASDDASAQFFSGAMMHFGDRPLGAPTQMIAPPTHLGPSLGSGPRVFSRPPANFATGGKAGALEGNPFVGHKHDANGVTISKAPATTAPVQTHNGGTVNVGAANKVLIQPKTGVTTNGVALKKGPVNPVPTASVGVASTGPLTSTTAQPGAVGTANAVPVKPVSTPSSGGGVTSTVPAPSGTTQSGGDGVTSTVPVNSGTTQSSGVGNFNGVPGNTDSKQPSNGSVFGVVPGSSSTPQPNGGSMFGVVPGNSGTTPPNGVGVVNTVPANSGPTQPNGVGVVNTVPINSGPTQSGGVGVVHNTPVSPVPIPPSGVGVVHSGPDRPVPTQTGGGVVDPAPVKILPTQTYTGGGGDYGGGWTQKNYAPPVLPPLFLGGPPLYPPPPSDIGGAAPPPPATGGAPPTARIPVLTGQIPLPAILTPPPGETRYRPNELLVRVLATATPQNIATLLRRHGLTEVEATTFSLTGVSIRLWRIGDNRTVTAAARELANERVLASVQPNYLYRPVEDAERSASDASAATMPAAPTGADSATPLTPAAWGTATPLVPADSESATPVASTAPEPAAPALVAPAAIEAPPTAAAPAASEASALAGSAPAANEPAAPATEPGMYALDKLNVDETLDLGARAPIKVALVDTAIDDKHHDLAGAVIARFDAVAGPARSFDHGTAMAGAIGARGRLRGVAPTVQLLSARAFDVDGAGGALGSTLSILKGIQWSADSGARIINMSFAGPRDPALHDILAAAVKKGIVLIGAMGNAGPKSPPLYPGADENVIAITATDADDKLYDMANVGPYVAAAAPGVDVLLPAPDDAYAFETGTSVSCALASGVAALALERHPAATPQDLRKWMTTSARRLGVGPASAVFGAGLIDARALVKVAAP